jgi:hypothetical protein
MNDLKREKHRAENEQRRKQIYVGAFSTHLTIVVDDPQCADPYLISANEFAGNFMEYWRIPGVKITDLAKKAGRPKKDA